MLTGHHVCMNAMNVQTMLTVCSRHLANRIVKVENSRLTALRQHVTVSRIKKLSAILYARFTWVSGIIQHNSYYF